MNAGVSVEDDIRVFHQGNEVDSDVLQHGRVRSGHDSCDSYAVVHS